MRSDSSGVTTRLGVKVRIETRRDHPHEGLPVLADLKVIPLHPQKPVLLQKR